mmetsp:Transcript_35585/g.62871  ORF Transcript_35585/g.62871 Transcript_35585/m.62871 type:complete len:173 (-) Transcript_35585:75-593(-)
MSSIVYVRGYEKGTTEADVKKLLQPAGLIKSVEKKSKYVAVTFANAKQAEKAMAELDMTTIPGQERYVKLKTEKPKKTGVGRKQKEKACKWCEQGECWTHGQIEMPPEEKAKSKKKVKNDKLKQPAMGKMMQAMMAMMMGGNKAKKSKGGNKGGQFNKLCKWCQQGECWTHA